MIAQEIRSALQEQQWTIVVAEENPPSQAPLIVLWKTFANGVAITLSVHHEQGQFVVYEDVGHAASGTKRTELDQSSTLDTVIHQMILECQQWDRIWET
jgi:hypothetical protein